MENAIVENKLLRNYETLKNFCNNGNLTYTPYDEDHVIVATYTGGNSSYRFCLYTADDEISISVSFPIKTPNEKLDIVSEFLMRLNFKVYLGYFMLDFNDGEILFRNIFTFGDNELSLETIEAIIFSSINTVDKFLHNILRIIYSGVSPKNEIEEMFSSES